ncbi:MAG: lipoprotein [Gammaproteobacteria bacterium]
MIRLVSILVLTLAVCACGVRGPLYLPETEAGPPEAAAGNGDPGQEDAEDRKEP